MKISRLILFVTIPLLLSLTTYAQKRSLEKAQKLFDSGEYFEAIEKYKKVHPKVKDKKEKAEIAFNLAECYRALNDAKRAKSWYSKAVRGKFADPKAVLLFADMLKKEEAYEDAKEQYTRYAEMLPDDPAGKIGIASCDVALLWMQKPSNIIVEPLSDISSKSMDYGPVPATEDNKTIYFVSTREGAKGEKFSNASGQNFSDIFSTTVDTKGEWSIPTPLQGEMNSVYDEGPFAFTKNFTQLFYTRCEQLKKANTGCRIYTSNKSGDSWSEGEELVLVKDSSITLGHPSISADGLTLYFASDLEGGKGGKDIWKVTRSSEGGTWSEPINLGDSINTPGDEMFPYIHADSSIYFASNYRLGMGGLDIFKYGPDKDGVWSVQNMRNPINSAADDFGISFDSTGKKGYFSSTREMKGKKSDNLYSFEIPELKFDMEGLVVNEQNGNPLGGVQVAMTGSDGTTVEAQTGSDGKFKFKLDLETDYVLVTTKSEFFKGKATETTKGLDKSTTIKVKIPMQPIIKEVAFEVENIFYDLDKATLRAESVVALDKLVDLLRTNETIQIELGSHTDFRGKDKYNQDLSQRRAQSVVDYLIQKGIKAERLVAKGYGETLPRKISDKLHLQYPEFPEGSELNESFINGLSTDELKEQAHQINRRTEFRVLRTDFDVNAINFGKQ